MIFKIVDLDFDSLFKTEDVQQIVLTLLRSATSIRKML